MVSNADIPPGGTKVDLTLKDIFGNPYTVSGKIINEPYQHGYHDPGGGWGLYSLKGDTPCFKIGFLPKGKRNPVILKVNDIVSVTGGCSMKRTIDELKAELGY